MCTSGRPWQFLDRAYSEYQLGLFGPDSCCLQTSRKVNVSQFVRWPVPPTSWGLVCLLSGSLTVVYTHTSFRLFQRTSLFLDYYPCLPTVRGSSLLHPLFPHVLRT